MMVILSTEVAAEAEAEAGVRGRIRERDVVEAEYEATASSPTETPPVKRRKLAEEEEEVDGEPRMISSPSVEITNCDGITVRDSAGPPETSVVVVGRTSSAEDQCQSPGSEDELGGGASISCCSSNGSSDKVNGRIEFLDLEPSRGAKAGTSTHYSCNTRSEMSLCFDRREESEEMNSTADREVKACDVAESRRRINMAADNSKMSVTETELEEFFTAAEKDLRSKIFECSKKYNFDFVKEEPLEGRYAWLRLKS